MYFLYKKNILEEPIRGETDRYDQEQELVVSSTRVKQTIFVLTT